MKTAILLFINLSLGGFFLLLVRKKALLTYVQGGKCWLTWLAIAIITLMGELTSVFYAPAEAFRFISPGRRSCESRGKTKSSSLFILPEKELLQS